MRDVVIKNKIQEYPDFEIHLGIREKNQVILKIAKTAKGNDILEKEKEFYEYIQNFYEINKNKIQVTDPELFAHLDSAFFEKKQDKQYLCNVFSLQCETMDGFIRLTELCDKIKIDIDTSRWILDFLYRVYKNYEHYRYALSASYHFVPLFSTDSFLICPKTRDLVFYNFLGEKYVYNCLTMVSKVSQFVLDWIDEKEIEEDQDKIKKEYIAALKFISQKGAISFEEAYHYISPYLASLTYWHSKRSFRYRERDSTEWKNLEY